MAGLGIGYYLRLDNWKTVTFGVGALLPGFLFLDVVKQSPHSDNSRFDLKKRQLG